MQRVILFIYAAFLLTTSFQPAQAQGKSVQFFMDVCRFHDTRLSDPTAEFYFSIDGTSVVHKLEQDNKFHAAVNIGWFLQRLVDGDSVGVAGDRIVLDWPENQFPDDTTSSKLRKHLFHLEYVKLPPGRYLLQTIVSDQNAPSKDAAIAFREFEMAPLTESELQFSDIKWIASRRNPDARINRQDLLPLVTNDAFINQDSMVFYQEIYNVSNEYDGRFIVRARIHQGDNVLYAFEATQARVANQINAFMMSLHGLEQLRSNTYHLQIDLLDSRNAPFASYRKKFYIYNSRLEQDFESLSVFNSERDIFNEYEEGELDYYLATLIWISTQQERDFTRSLETSDQKRNYLFSFWEKRKRFPEQKVAALWRGHLMAIDYVNQQFTSNLNEGWKTDRGRVFLKYGIPSDVERYPSGPAGSIPWEMWRYDQLGAQAGVIFVFYDPNLATGEFPLLHSSKYGEVFNPRWQEQLRDPNSKITPGSIDFDDANNSRLIDQFDPNN